MGCVDSFPGSSISGCTKFWSFGSRWDFTTSTTVFHIFFPVRKEKLLADKCPHGDQLEKLAPNQNKPRFTITTTTNWLYVSENIRGLPRQLNLREWSPRRREAQYIGHMFCCVFPFKDPRIASCIQLSGQEIEQEAIVTRQGEKGALEYWTEGLPWRAASGSSSWYSIMIIL